MKIALYLTCFSLQKEKKGRDLTQSYDKSSYSNKNVNNGKVTIQTKQPKVRLPSDCGTAWNGQLEKIQPPIWCG